MDRFVVMVDAGYLLRQSIEIVSNKLSTQRNQLEITDPAGLINTLIDKCRVTLELGDRELLRVYWYDGVMVNGLTTQQRSIINLPDVHFRAGIVNSAGKQKGVDSLIVTDLIELASNHAICDAALVTGDSDLAVGIEISQKKGVRIAVIGVEDLSVGVSHKQSFEITSRADRIDRLGGAELATVMRYVPAVVSQPSVAGVAAAAGQSTPPKMPKNKQPSDSAGIAFDAERKLQIKQCVDTFIKNKAISASSVDSNTKRIDSTVDRELIHHVFTVLNSGKLTNAEKIHARFVLRSAILP